MPIKWNKVKMVCETCEGSGVNEMMSEDESQIHYGIVCSECGGMGYILFKYREFKKKKIIKDSKLYIGRSHLIRNTEGKSGLYYEDWLEGKPFPYGKEDRKNYCPNQWYQTEDFNMKVEFYECGFGAFADCKLYNNKQQCWDRMDTQMKKKALDKFLGDEDATK